MNDAINLFHDFIKCFGEEEGIEKVIYMVKLELEEDAKLVIHY
jgi:hypothetical protein